MKAPISLFSAGRRSVLPAAVIVVWALAGGCSNEPTPQPAARTLTIAYSNDLNGEILSCGCPADDQGGLGRRATFVEIVHDTSANFLLLDAGDLFGREIQFSREKAEITMKSIALMGYHGVAVGENEFGFGVDYLVKRSEENELPLLAANIYDATADTLLFRPVSVVELADGTNAGLIGVTGNDLKMPPQVPDGSIRITDPVKAVQREVKRFGDDVGLIVVLAHVNLTIARKIAENVPEVDIVVCGHDSRPMRNIRQFGSAYILQTSGKGMNMGLAFAVFGNDRRIRKLENQLVPLFEVYENHEAIAKLFRAYDMSAAAKEKADIPPAVFEASAGLKKPFTGSGACKECHEEQFVVWEGTAHAHAFAVLEEQNRTEDKDCIPCHTTGFYTRGGYEHLSATPGLIGVGCESCHGNGHDHVGDPKTPTGANPGDACTQCHTARFSPEFDHEAYWELIRH